MRRSKQPSSRSLWQFIALLWILEMVDQSLLNRQLDGLGLQPGNWNHWEGILFMPFLHIDFYHLLNNSIGLAIFGTLLITRSWDDLYYASIGAILGCSLAVMLLGKPGSVHIGASGLVFGWWSFLIARAFYQRNFQSALIAVSMIVFFGGMIYGILPGEKSISWQGHLGGAIGGIIGSRLTKKKSRRWTIT
jgi:membrane associated rhomboid family serine protease